MLTVATIVLCKRMPEHVVAADLVPPALRQGPLEVVVGFRPGMAEAGRAV